MKFTLGWLKRHLDTDASLETICEVLTDIGLELEELEDRAKEFAPFKVAEVLAAAPHPDADKLQILTVKTADHDGLQVVCGAPNARAGMKGIFAPEGTYIPALDVTLKKTKIRGVESNGMMVSEREMGLSNEHEGIIEVLSSYEIGTPMAEVFGLDDPIIDIALTPNRADCAGVRGIARDLAAAGIGTLIEQDESPVACTFDSAIGVSIDDTEGCSLFLGREIRNIKNGASPKWFQDLLKAVGQKPISALVDITNFMTLDQCRPLHVYDADKLKGNIRVGAAKGGEKLDALNDKSYELVEGAVSINDDSGVIGLGGIVGGVSTGCEEDASHVFVEAAYFKPERIARAGRDHGVESDARYRFERGVDPEFTFAGMELATRLILEFCGTDQTEISHVVQAGAMPEWKRVIDFDPAYTKQLIGIDVEADKQVTILESLGFVVEGAKVTPPSWRGDVFGRADLTEEVARIVGFDAIPEISVRAESSVAAPAETPMLSRSRQARIALGARGMSECVTWSFLSQDNAKRFGLNDNAAREALTVVNAISSEIDVMRPSILPNLIDAAQNNAARGYGDVALCEVGPVFAGTKPEDQDIVAAGIRSGHHADRHWADDNAARGVDVYDAKADAFAALEAIGAPAANAQITRDAPDYYHPGRSGTVRLGKNVLAYFGELHPAILEEMDVKAPTVGFEIFLGNVPEARSKGTEKPYLKLAALQPIEKDFAFLVDDVVEASALINAAKAADKVLISDAYVFDIYQGQGVPEGKKSVALSVAIQPQETTLTDHDIDALMQKVIDLVTSKTGGSLRG